MPPTTIFLPDLGAPLPISSPRTEVTLERLRLEMDASVSPIAITAPKSESVSLFFERFLSKALAADPQTARAVLSTPEHPSGPLASLTEALEALFPGVPARQLLEGAITPAMIRGPKNQRGRCVLMIDQFEQLLESPRSVRARLARILGNLARKSGVAVLIGAPENHSAACLELFQPKPERRLLPLGLAATLAATAAGIGFAFFAGGGLALDSRAEAPETEEFFRNPDPRSRISPPVVEPEPVVRAPELEPRSILPAKIAIEPLPPENLTPVTSLSALPPYERGEVYLFGKDGVEREPERAIELFESAHESGDARATQMLGNCYAKGIGVERDFDRALKFFEAAADLGAQGALGNLGVMHLKGQGVPSDPERAVQLLTRGAKSGDPVAAFYLGRCFEDGIGLAADPEQAREWIVRGARGGHLAAIAWCADRGIEIASTEPAR